MKCAAELRQALPADRRSLSLAALPAPGQGSFPSGKLRLLEGQGLDVAEPFDWIPAQYTFITHGVNCFEGLAQTWYEAFVEGYLAHEKQPPP